MDAHLGYLVRGLLIACWVAVPPVQAQQLNWMAFAQLTAQSTESDDSIEFGADAVRIGFNAAQDQWSGRLVLELNADNPEQSKPGSLPNMILDVFGTYQFDARSSLRFGLFKTPVGMDFWLPGTGLDITKRGMEKGLVLDRDIGIMLSGRKFDNGLGYDIGVFNPAGRSSATRHIGSGPLDQAGKDLAYAARVLFDPGEQFHAELSWGASQDAGGPNTDDYTVLDVGASWRKEPWIFKGEYITGSGVRGAANRDESVFYLHGEYVLSPKWTALVRYYHGESDIGSVTTDLDNTFFGVTRFFDQQRRSNNRLMINYVLVGGDTVRYTGVRGFREDALYVQYQFHYAD